MKILSLIFAAAVIVLSACQLVTAQKPQNLSAAGKGKIITESEFGALVYQAREKLEAQNHRVKTIEEVFSGANAAPDEIRTEIDESAPAADKMRVVLEIKNAAGAMSKTGFMMIGKERYRIDANGEWVLDPGSGWGGGVGRGSGGAERDTRIYKFIGKSTLAGKPVLVYEVSGIHPGYFNKQFAETDETTRYWFSPDGKLLRREGTNAYPDLNLRVKTLVVNEYNARVNIQPPAKK